MSDASKPQASGGVPAGYASLLRELQSARQGEIPVQRAASRASWFEQAVDSLSALLTLPSNWNSYGAPPVEPTALHLMLKLLSSLQATMPEPRILPTSRGGVQIEWHCGGVDLEIEPTAEPEHYLALFEGELIADWEGEVTIDSPRLTTMLEEISRRSR